MQFRILFHRQPSFSKVGGNGRSIKPPITKQYQEQVKKSIDQPAAASRAGLGKGERQTQFVGRINK
jgi:hypothetical protein